MMDEQSLAIGLSPELQERIRTRHVRSGRLFGALSQNELEPGEIRQLIQSGWLERPYQDEPVMIAPQITINWDRLRQQHRDHTLHAVSHRLPAGAPWAGTRQAILEELLASLWETREDELRTILHAWAYASMWDAEGEHAPSALESQETFFFYTRRMKDSAEEALAVATEAPEAHDEFWTLVNALVDLD